MSTTTGALPSTTASFFPTAAQTFAPRPTTCFQITNPVIFTDFDSAYIRPQPDSYNSTVTLEQSVASLHVPQGFDVLSILREEVGCPGSDFTVRYYRSITQAYLVQLSQTPLLDDFKCPANPPSVKSLCRATCRVFDRFAYVWFDNPSICLPAANISEFQAQNRRFLISLGANCDLFPETNCLPAVAFDTGNCGFYTPTEAANYCRAGGLGEIDNDNCCLQLTGEFAVELARATRGAFSATTSGAAGGSGGSGGGSFSLAQVLAIAVPLAVVALAAVVVALVVVLRRRRRDQASKDSRESNLHPVPYNGSSASASVTTQPNGSNVPSDSVDIRTEAGETHGLSDGGTSDMLLQEDMSRTTSARDMALWSSEQVSWWILASGFAQDIADTLRARNVDGRKLLGLTDDALAALGVQSPNVRAMLLAAVGAVCEGEGGSARTGAGRGGGIAAEEERVPLPVYSV
ncbi:hypothetical protein HDU96_007736 [Phlyctochytrium bullatum]|nr:hypothetical protein HDU96_007736 [Phlyctochytrium bullatum]